jgi:cytochrome c oxidase subunit 6a
MLHQCRLVASGINAYSLFTKHSHHMEEHPREWVKYPYMNYRAKVSRLLFSFIALLTNILQKDFFWGKESLFFNPKTNLSSAE